MKVKTLIRELSKFNPEAEVRLNDYDGDTALFVNARVDDDNIVWLDGVDDFDLGSELEARFEIAIEEQMDELDFYMDLLEIGITIKQVEEYMGIEKANHMKKFCKEHGLI